MQFALSNGKIVEAGIDAPRAASCLKCGKPVIVWGTDIIGYKWQHSNLNHERSCTAQYNKAQKQLDDILGIER